MRIIEDYHDCCELYSEQLRKRVEEVFKYTSHITELRRTLTLIKAECEKLREFFLTPEEIKERKDMLDFFDARVKAMAFYTIKNMEKYRLFGWKELIYDEDFENE